MRRQRPAQPSPPIAVTRRSLVELPARVSLSDRDAMIPGRLLSAYERFEVEVRASATGNPAADRGVRGVVGLFERAFPVRVCGYFPA